MKTEQLAPSWILIAVLALMFCTEEALMYSLDHFFPQTMSQQARALINAGALTLIMAPFIWWLVRRRLKPARMSEAAMTKAAAGAAADAIITTAEHGLIESVNPAAAMMSGHEANEVTGESVATPMNEPPSGENGLQADVTQRKAAEERIRRLTRHDSVTGLADQQNFYHCLDQDIAAAGRDHKELALVFLSLARFRHVNPALGQRAGDRILATVGERIRFQARRSDMVAEMGGDEFAVIMANGASRRNALDVSSRIIGALSKPFYLDGQKQAVQIDVSIGIAIFPADGQDAESLVRAAHAEMEKAK